MKVTAPNYTQVPNCILDAMAELSEPQLRVLLTVCRQTFGWQRESAVLSISFLQKATGLSNTAVTNASYFLVEKEILSKHANGPRGASVYKLMVDDLGPSFTCESGSQEPMSEKPKTPETTYESGSHKETKVLETKEIKDCEQGSPHQKFYAFWKMAFKQKFGFEYDFKAHGGRDGKAVKELLHLKSESELEELVTTAWAHSHPDAFWCGKLNVINLLRIRINEIQSEVKLFQRTVKRDYSKGF